MSDHTVDNKSIVLIYIKLMLNVLCDSLLQEYLIYDKNFIMFNYIMLLNNLFN